jgi:hypothetical protein
MSTSDLNTAQVSTTDLNTAQVSTTYLNIAQVSTTYLNTAQVSITELYIHGLPLLRPLGMGRQVVCGLGINKMPPSIL